MPARISFSLALLDALGCLGLGFCLSALRALLPARRGSAFTFAADLVASVAALLLAQSYAARQAAAGELRWYLTAALILGAAAAQKVLAPPLRRLRAAAARPFRRLQKRVVAPLRMKYRHTAENTAKKRRIKGQKNLFCQGDDATL